MYIREFEQRGRDRADYGDALLKSIASRLRVRRLRGFSETNLRLFRQFYRTYQEIRQTLSDETRSGILKALPTPSQSIEVVAMAIHQTASDELAF